MTADRRAATTDGSAATPAAPLTWVYCLVRDATAPDLAEAPPGLPDAAPPRLLSVTEAQPAPGETQPAPGETQAAPGESRPGGEGLWLVVADVPRQDYTGAAIEARLGDDLGWVSERALAHERVARHLHGAGGAQRGVLPVKLFTLFRDDRRARAWAAGQRQHLASVLARLAGRVELGVRVRFDPEAAPGEGGAAAGATAGRTGRPASGAEFLRAKSERRRQRQEAASRAPAAALAAHEALAAAAEDARRLPLPEAAGSLLLDAAYLVASARVDDFEQVVARVAGDLRDARCELTLTGPWPPYNFAAGPDGAEAGRAGADGPGEDGPGEDGPGEDGPGQGGAGRGGAPRDGAAGGEA